RCLSHMLGSSRRLRRVARRIACPVRVSVIHRPPPPTPQYGGGERAGRQRNPARPSTTFPHLAHTLSPGPVHDGAGRPPGSGLASLAHPPSPCRTGSIRRRPRGRTASRAAAQARGRWADVRATRTVVPTCSGGLSVVDMGYG